MKNWNAHTILVLFVVSVCFFSPAQAGEGGPPGDNERLVGPVIEAILGLADSPPPSGSSFGSIEGVLLGTCNGTPFEIIVPAGIYFGTVATIHAGEWNQGGLLNLHINAPGICNPKPGAVLNVVGIKKFKNTGKYVLAEITLMFLEPK
jgi:hypothetical protein